MYLGLFGTYRKHEAVDVEYRLGGKTELAADVEIVPDPSWRPAVKLAVVSDPSRTGGCLCGGVRFELTEPAQAAG